ncbi:MAG TPA: ISL3 family transposase [Chloroflexota bacterium]|nr:ISL3 family transposase [Chloroflexota bacterium]
MSQQHTLTPVLPFALPGCRIDAVRCAGTTLLVDAHTIQPSRPCPACGQASARVHSRYLRLVRDLPSAGQPVRLLLRVRRFFCGAPSCPKRTFAERLPDLVPYRARQTPRCTQALRAIGFAVGGEAGARLATRLGLRTSADTLLRLLRASPTPPAPPAIVIGLDDFALRKGRVYGTILVDLERRRPIDLLPERTADAVAARLRANPQITVVARDRSAEYARGVTAGAPQATQVADRFHLLYALREAVQRYVHQIRPDLRRLLSTVNASAPSEDRSQAPSTIDAPPSPHYDPGPARRRVQAAKHAERERRFRQVKEAQARGLNQRQIVRTTGLSLATVRLWLAADVLPAERRGYRRAGKVDPYGPYLLRRLADGCTNQTLLWQEIGAQGFVGTRSLVSKWLRAHRSGWAPAGATEPKLPGAQHLAWLVLRADDDRLAPGDRALWECLRQHEGLRWLQEMSARFVMMVRERDSDAFDRWLADCRTGPVPELRHFAAGLEKDGAAVRAALTLPYSNGPTEGHINKLKLIKRGAFGRMKLDLLRQRVLHAA